MTLSFKIISLGDFKENFGDKCGSLNLYWLLFSTMPNLQTIGDRVLVLMLHEFSNRYIKNSPDSHYFLDPSLLKKFQYEELRTPAKPVDSLDIILNECVLLVDSNDNRSEEHFLIILKGKGDVLNHAFSIGVENSDDHRIYTLNEIYEETPFFIQKRFHYRSDFKDELEHIYRYKQSVLNKRYSHIQCLKLEVL